MEVIVSFENQLSTLPINVFLNILDNLQKGDLNRLSLVNKNLRSRINGVIEQWTRNFFMKIPDDELQAKSMTNVVDALGEKFPKLTVIDVRESFKNNDYIDYILPNQLPGSIAIGIDHYNRPFVAFKLIARSEINFLGEIRNPYEFVQTIFQRYAAGSDMGAWRWGGQHVLRNGIFDSVCIDTSELKEILIKLFSNTHSDYELVDK